MRISRLSTALLAVLLALAISGCPKRVEPEPAPTPTPEPSAIVPTPTPTPAIVIGRIAASPKTVVPGDILTVTIEMRLRDRRPVSQRSWVARKDDRKNTPIFPPVETSFAPEKKPTQTQVWEFEVPPAVAPGVYRAWIELSQGRATRRASSEFTVKASSVAP